MEDVNANGNEDHVQEHSQPLPRRPKRKTNWRYRRDALSASDVLLVEQLKDRIDSFLWVAWKLSQELLALTAALLTTTTWTPAWRSVFSLWLFCNGQFVSLLHACDQMQAILNDVVWTHPANRMPDAFPPPINRSIDSTTEEWVYKYTRLNKHQLRRLKRHLHVPNRFAYETDPSHRYTQSGEAVMLVALAYLCTDEPLYSLIPSEFGGDP